MDIRKIIQRRIRSGGGGVNAVGDVDATISATVGKSGGSSHLSSRSRKRIVQRSGRTVVSEDFETGKARVSEDQTTETVELAGVDRERTSEPELPPIDEDVTGQVNAAVPPREDES